MLPLDYEGQVLDTSGLTLGQMNHGFDLCNPGFNIWKVGRDLVPEGSVKLGHELFCVSY